MENYLPDLSNIWPEWRAVQKLGEGSFGKVYKCERNEYGINTVCAVKIISIPQNESEINAVRAECTNEDSVKAHFKEIVDDFANEIKIMVDLKGAPNIVTVENYKIVEREDSIGWDIYIRMEYLTAFTDFARKNTFTEKAVAKLAADICEALEICAGKNIIHRDIKPDNIFIDSYGNYKIGDFGVARKLENASIAMSKKGTYTYMAPEVYKGEAYDNRADIYSLGMVMYRLLNRGKDPFTNPAAEMVTRSERENALVQRMNGYNLPAPIDASVDMAKIIIKACAFNPNYRFATPRDFKNALNAFMSKPEGNDATVTVPVSKDYSASRSNSAHLFRNSVSASASDSATVIAGPVPQQIPVQPVKPVQPQRPVQPQVPVPPQRPVPPQMPVQPPAPQKKSKKGIVAIIIAILVIAAAGVGVYFALQGNIEIGKPKNDAETIASIKSDYIDNKITYDEAVDGLDKYLKSDDSDTKKKAKKALEEIENVSPYRNDHLAAKDYIANNDYPSALELLYGISSGYPQYDEVNDLIVSAKNDYKEYTLSQVEQMTENGDFSAARDAIIALEEYVDNPDVFDAYDIINNAELEYYYNAQQVYVVPGSEEFFYDSNNYCLRANIRNDSGKTTNTVVLSILEYDVSGNPVYVSSYQGTYDNEYRVNTKSPISPYSTLDMTAEAIHWSYVSTDAYYAVACVDYVEFSDGTKWENPYHELWLEEYNASYSSWQNKSY